MPFLNSASEVIKKAVDNKLIPGATYAFINNNNVEYGCYGYKEVEPELLATSLNTLYDLASCSKVVATTTMILKLIEEKIINLDDLVCKHLENCPYKDITIKNLLTHTSGLVPDDKRYKLCHNKKELIDFMFSLEPENKKDQLVHYSDFNFIILGLIIEKYKGSLDGFLKEMLLEPLDMTNTLYQPINRIQDCAASEITKERGLVKGIVHDGKAFIMGGVSGHAGLFSDIKDLSKFVLMMLNNGEKVFKKETIDLLKKSYTNNLNESRTLGWIFADKTSSCGNQISDISLYHTGFSGTSIYIDYVNKCGIILLTNRVHPTRDNNHIIDIRKEFHNAILKNYN